MTSVMLSLEGAVVEATILVRIIDKLDAKAAPCWWELADLSAKMVLEDGERAQGSKRLRTSEWAERIGWTKPKGKSEATLKAAITLARAWPEQYRVEEASFWQHREALDHFKGNVQEAGKWLASADRPNSVRDVTRSGVMGTGPIYDAIRVLARARAGIVRVPSILAAANALGTEPNFDQLRNEVKRLKRGMTYLDRYLADEITIDMDEFQAGLDKILKEAS